METKQKSQSLADAIRSALFDVQPPQHGLELTLRSILPRAEAADALAEAAREAVIWYDDVHRNDPFDHTPQWYLAFRRYCEGGQ